LQQTDQQLLESAGQAIGYVSSAAIGIFIIAAIMVIAFHWTLEGQRTIQSFLQLFSIDKRESIGEMISAMEAKVGYYIVGQGILCLIIGVLALVTYLLIVAQCPASCSCRRCFGSSADDRTASRCNPSRGDRTIYITRKNDLGDCRNACNSTN
jgi:hypothetical protein